MKTKLPLLLSTAALSLVLAIVPAFAADPAPSADANTLTAAEKAAGWRLLFDGTSLTGWHNFKKEGVRAGWQVKDGALTCVDPHDAGDIVTTDKFAWFEIQFDYNISEGGNSGLMYRVTDEGAARCHREVGDEVDAFHRLEGGCEMGDVNDGAERPTGAAKPASHWM